MKFETVSEVKRNAEENGSHFFDRDTMKFFCSKIEGLYRKQFLLTSEKRCFDDYRREYTVRFCKANGTFTSIRSTYTKDSAKWFIQDLYSQAGNREKNILNNLDDVKEDTNHREGIFRFTSGDSFLLYDTKNAKYIG